MPKFKYHALSPEGIRVTGVVRGSTAPGVAASLVEQGLEVRAVTREKRNVLNVEITPKKIKLHELMNFSRQMAAFLAAGVPILDALAIIREESGDKTLRRVVGEVSDALRFGESFSSAMAAHGDALPRFYVSVLRSAEVTGQLDVVLAQLSRYIERELDARKKLRSAIAYPTIVMIMAVVTVFILTFFVLPRFKDFFAEFNATLPLPTRMLIAVADFVANWWWAIVGGIVATLVAVVVGIRTEFGRGARDRLFLKLPVVGDVVRFTVVERFCRIMSAMVQAGVPVPEALELAMRGTNNTVFEKALGPARAQMLQGGGIYGPIARTELFPGPVVQMIRVGEETGTLDQQLESLAAFYEKELEYKLKTLTSLFEPIMIVFVGVVVGFVAIALVSAMYGIYNQVDLN